MFKFAAFLISFMIISINSFAQLSTINGVVKDEKSETLPGVNVLIKGTSTGSTTDINGKYSISNEINDSSILVFSYVGYNIQEVLVAGRMSIDVQLVPSSKDLDEYVVVGYGTTSVKELTGATAKIKGENIEKLNLSRMDQALQGQVAGVSINTNSGSPGGSSSIRIRGLSTFGDNDPLILVDGVVYDSEGLNALNPSDIASINILKDNLYNGLL